jgi:hypothetical protein
MTHELDYCRAWLMSVAWEIFLPAGGLGFSPGVAFAIDEDRADIQLNPCPFSYVEPQMRVRIIDGKFC